jgi:tryptophan synthase alpha chain
MSRIETGFKGLNKKRQAALIPFIVAGDPDLETTEALVVRTGESGADMIELGVPFSDPLADGPTIQAASYRALQKGGSLKEIFGMTRRLMGRTPPLILMTYFNPIFRYGLKAYAAECKENGIEGVIVPDLPPEEAEPWVKEARASELDTIFLLSPTSSPGRTKMVDRLSRGFIYYVSVTGVTGARGTLPEELEQGVRKIKEQTRKPVAVGFGISTPEQAKEVSRFADGVIVGSAIVKIIEENVGSPDLVSRVGEFVTSLSGTLKSMPLQ